MEKRNFYNIYTLRKIEYTNDIWVNNVKKRKRFAGILLALLLFLNGCSVEKSEPKKIKDLDFTLVEDSQVPENLRALIEEKKATEMKITMDDGESKYIVAGYGIQKSGGYSISVDELYLTDNAIYINTTLIGPAKGEMVPEATSFPYVVLRIAYLDKSVVFE